MGGGGLATGLQGQQGLGCLHNGVADHRAESFVVIALGAGRRHLGVHPGIDHGIANLTWSRGSHGFQFNCNAKKKVN